MSPGEWADAGFIDLGAIPGNRLPAYLLVKNNESLLWLAYDAVGDTTSDSNDSASFALDTGHDGVGTNGAEDQFAILGAFTAHLVFANGSWTFHDFPFDPGLPDHAGLAARVGFGPSDRNATNHSIFEFQVPLALIGTTPGDTIGFFGGSQPAPGVVDYRTFAYSTWPDFVGGPIQLNQYGDLNLDTPPGPVGVSMSPPSVTAIGRANETVRYDLTVRNKGTSGGDTFDITYLSAWPASLWDASGNTPLADTDADAIPDTGNVSSGGSVVIVVKVSIPANTSGCSSAIVLAASSRNTSVADSSNLTTCTAAASFQPPHSDVGVDTDVPPNGFFDLLEIDAVVQVSSPGLYYLEGSLYAGNGSVIIDRGFSSASLSSGIQTVPLTISGRSIYASGIDGPYLAQFVLRDASFAVVDNDTHITRPYRATDFDPLAAVFDPPHRDFGRDTDVPPNGLFDELVVETGLRVNQAGDFEISASLYDQVGRYVTGTFRRFSLSQGVTRVEVAFPGTLINQARADGPYQVSLSLYDALRFEFLDSDTHVTAAYRAAQFDPPPVAFAPPHSDFGLDADAPPDGFYDWLVVRASLSVAEAGTFFVSSNLWDRLGQYVTGTSQLAELDPGARTVDLRFPGPTIAERGGDGPYTVSMFATKFEDFNFSAYDMHVTRPYLATQFAAASGQLLRPYSDRAIDSDVPADGLYEWLTVDVGVNVTRAGNFTVQVVLSGSTFNILAAGSNQSALALGESTVSVAIDGRPIRDSAAEGPYFAAITLLDRHAAQIDRDLYVTQAYSANQFQPHDRAGPTSTASVPGGYRRNTLTFSVGYAATDPSPSDGLAGVTLYYRSSADNATWSSWTPYATKSLSGSTSSGTFSFVAPGDGYFEFATVAEDRSGNVEAPPIAPEAAAAVFVPARLEVIATTTTLQAGVPAPIQVRVLSERGEEVLLAEPLTVTLLTTSPEGEFRASGSQTRISAITVPAGQSAATFDYVDARPGTVSLTLVAAGVAPVSVNVTVVGGFGISAEAGAGLAVGVVVGVGAGVAVGWLLPRWRKKREPPAIPPPPGSSP